MLASENIELIRFPGMKNNESKIQRFTRNASIREFYLLVNFNKVDHILFIYKSLLTPRTLIYSLLSKSVQP